MFLFVIAGMPIVAVVVLTSATSLLGLVVVVYCSVRYWRRYRDQKASQNSSPDTGSGHSFPVHNPANLKISQSVPDLVDSGLMQQTYATPVLCAEQKIGKNLYKTVVKQTTMPIVPQRHLFFQRQLSHKLDLSNVEFTIHSVKYKEQPDMAGRLKPELYRQNAQEMGSMVDQSNSGNLGSQDTIITCGKLYFSLHFCHQTSTLTVHVLRAEGLPAKDFSGTSDPYAKIYLLPDRKKKFQTKVHRKTLCPEFNEKFAFHVSYSDLQQRVLQFSIYDFDRFSRHDLIGVVMLKDIGHQMDLRREHLYEMDIVCVQQVSQFIL